LKEDIVILETQVFINPFSDEEMAQEKEEEEKLKRAKEEEVRFFEFHTNKQTNTFSFSQSFPFRILNIKNLLFSIHDRMSTDSGIVILKESMHH
jgi:hypothetical protein